MKYLVAGYIGTRADSSVHYIKVDAEDWNAAVKKLRKRWPYFRPVFAFTLDDWNRHVYSTVIPTENWEI